MDKIKYIIEKNGSPILDFDELETAKEVILALYNAIKKTHRVEHKQVHSDTLLVPEDETRNKVLYNYTIVKNIL